jgi:hypothetical protein
MMLSFTGPNGEKRFEILYAALLTGGDGKGDRSPITIRREARLFDSFDSISMAVNGNPEQRVLSADEPRVELTVEEFDLLSGYANLTPWTPRASRAAVDTWEWLKTIPKE